MSLKCPVNGNFASKIFSNDIAVVTYSIKICPSPLPFKGDGNINFISFPIQII